MVGEMQLKCAEIFHTRQQHDVGVPPSACNAPPAVTARRKRRDTARLACPPRLCRCRWSYRRCCRRARRLGAAATRRGRRLRLRGRRRRAGACFCVQVRIRSPPSPARGRPRLRSATTASRRRAAAAWPPRPPRSSRPARFRTCRSLPRCAAAAAPPLRLLHAALRGHACTVAASGASRARMRAQRLHRGAPPNPAPLSPVFRLAAHAPPLLLLLPAF